MSKSSVFSKLSRTSPLYNLSTSISFLTWKCRNKDETCRWKLFCLRTRNKWRIALRKNENFCLSFCIQCRLEGIPVLTDISLWEVLVYMVEYHWRQVQWLIFRVQFWSNFDEDGNLFTYVPPSRPRMKWSNTPLGNDIRIFFLKFQPYWLFGLIRTCVIQMLLSCFVSCSVYLRFNLYNPEKISQIMVYIYTDFLRKK